MLTEDVIYTAKIRETTLLIGSPQHYWNLDLLQSTDFLRQVIVQRPLNCNNVLQQERPAPSTANKGMANRVREPEIGPERHHWTTNPDQ